MNITSHSQNYFSESLYTEKEDIEESEPEDKD